MKIKDFDKLVFGLASPEDILSWSYGEVKKPETINYRTFKPERDGLFCEKIFGPVKDYECHCGKYKGQRYEGITCDRCGVTVTKSSVRRERMGHIKLAVPVVHIWYFKNVPNYIGLLLNISSKQLEEVIYYHSYIVLDPGDTPLQKMQVLTEEEYEKAYSDFGDGFKVGMGAEAIKKLLKELDLEELSFDLKKQIEEIQGQKRAKLIKRLEIVESFRLSGNKPEWMVLEVLPVIPPDLRPMVQLEGGKFATSDLNDLYRRVINRNNRLAKLLEINAPEIIVRNEKRMLQEAVDALIDNGRRGKPVTNASGRALRSLSDILEGKQGRFRQNLLGKRVDFSGRAVIVVGPELKLHQCGLPKKMALELFKPFVINKLIEHGYATNVKNARKKIEREASEVWDVLDEIIKEKLVLLNRAPTLHRVSIQAFEPKLIDGNAIQLHPLVCPPYNADFDGDQMAVHVPLSIEAQAEARILMLSANNLISPAHGKPLTLPTQDVVLGLYYLTLMVPGREVEDKRFATPEEVLLALENKRVDLHSKVYVHKKGMEEAYNISLPDQPAFIETTPGRLILNEIVPEKLRYYNVTLNRREVRKIVEKCFEVYGWSKTAEFLDELKRLGFEYATKAGVSFSIVDIEIPKEAKEKVIKKAEEESTLLQKAVESGLYAEEERYHRAIEIWTKATEEVKDIMLANFDILNSVYMMAFSGARGNVDQVRQLAAMRGLMADPSGQIMDIPIKSSFYEGLTVSEHFISSYGARKGVVDTALRTSDSGYLTRRLVDVAQSLVIREEDCGTDDGIYVEALEDEGKIVLSLKDRIIGRFAAEDVYNDKGELIIAKNEYIDVEKAKLVEKFGIKRVKIRSPMTCKSEKGICQKCYGEDLATHRLVNIGEAVGVIAAQSIGEPGTQLTMRTFHTGGVALTSLNYQNIQFRVTGKVDFVDLKFKDRFEVLGKREKMVVGRNGKVVVKGDGQEEEIIIPPGAIISIESGSDVTKGMSLGYIDPNLRYITSPYSGKVVRVEKVLENRSKRFNLVNVRYNRDINKYELSFNEETHTVFCSVVLLDQSGNELRVELPEGATFLFRIGDLIDEGDLIAEYSRETMKIQACEDGKVVNILERNGEIIDKVVATGEAVVVVRNNDGKEIEYKIPRGLKLHVNVGDHVEFGTILAYFPSYQQRTAKTEDIVQGLPRVEELFEARRPKGKSIIAGVSGIVRITRTKSGEKIIIEGEDGSKDEHILPHNAQLLVKEGDYVTVGQELTKGYRNPAEILANEGLAAVQRYIVDEVQKVYLKQGAEINDKHIEVIVRQMTNRVRIEDPGDSNFLFGQLVNKVTFEKVEKQLREEGKRPPSARGVVLGITKAALTTESVISAASFQETTRVLAEAAVKGKEDYLEGLKENVIIGRLIPAGTGLFKRIVPQKRTAKKVEVLEDGGEVEINS